MAKNEIAKSKENLPQKFDYGEDAGKGYENQTQRDKALPWLTILQDLSPQVKQGEGNIEGAKVGMFCNTLTRELFHNGVDVVLAATDHAFFEYKPDRGGFVGRRSITDPEVMHAQRTQPFGKYKTKVGNDLTETFCIYGVVVEGGRNPEPFIMAITGTKIKPYRQFNTRLDMFSIGGREEKAVEDGEEFTVQVGGQKPPLYAHLIRMSSFLDQRGKNTFYNIRLQGAVEDKFEKGLLQPTDPRFLAAKALSRIVISGDAKVDYDATRESAEDVF